MEWKTVKLGEVCDRVCSGGTPNSRNNKYYDGGIPWLNTKEIDFGRIYSTERTISQEGLENSSAKWIDENSVIVAMYGATAGKVAVSKIRLTTNQACCNLHIDEKKADYNFVYYYLLDNFSILASLANGGAQQNLNAQIIKDFLISLPPLEDQRRIASILSSLDDKIENNNRINRNLEAQAQALFKSWFVDFEPFGGSVPNDWKEGVIADLTNLLNGFAFKSSDFVEDGQYKLITIKGVQDGKMTIDGADCLDMLPNKMPQWCQLQKGDILLSLTGNVGRCCLVDMDNCLLNQRVAKLQPKAEYNRLFVYSLFRQESMKARMIGISRGTAQMNLSPVETGKLSLIIPTEEVLQKFGERYNSIIATLLNNIEESARLATLRDTLLPKLMKGEIEV